MPKNQPTPFMLESVWVDDIHVTFLAESLGSDMYFTVRTGSNHASVTETLQNRGLSVTSNSEGTLDVPRYLCEWASGYGVTTKSEDLYRVPGGTRVPTPLRIPKSGLL